MRESARPPLRHRADRRAGRRAWSMRSSGCSRAKARDITEENIQSRARGLILMAISNKTGAMVVTTGNKSEMSVGYATLYGDMNGGFNPIKDLYKMEVFRLAALRNRWKPGGRARAGWRGDPSKHHRQAAERGTAREPEGRGFAAALSGARRDSARPRRKGDARRRHCGGRLRPGNGAQESSVCSISPNTSAASRRRGSRWGPRISAATGAIRSSTASAIRATRRKCRTLRSRRRRRPE